MTICTHCHQSINDISDIIQDEDLITSDTEPNKTNSQYYFCCYGCKAAFNIIKKFRFEKYYYFRGDLTKKQDADGANFNDLKPEEPIIKDYGQFANIINNKPHNYKITLLVQNLHCGACVWVIENIIRQNSSVVKANLNLGNKILDIEYYGEQSAINESLIIINNLGYKLTIFDSKIINELEKKGQQELFIALAVAGFGAGNVMLFSFALWFADVKEMGVATRNLFHFFSALLALPIVIFSGRIFFKSAISAIRKKSPHMDIAITIAIILACIVSLIEAWLKKPHLYFDSAVMLIFFLLIGRYLDFKARKKVFDITSEFAMINCGYGNIINDDGSYQAILASEIRKGMKIMVNSGERFLADGIIIKGESEVDNSLISGETSLIKISQNSRIYSGMINISAPVIMIVDKDQKDSMLSQIITITSNIHNKKSNFIRIADQITKYYLPIIHIIAFATLIFWHLMIKIPFSDSLMNATAVLVISCPCALALAVPIAQAIIIAKMLKKGILITNGEVIEKINKIDLIAFDKTGSLTIGKLNLLKIIDLNKNCEIDFGNIENNQEILGLIYHLAVNSNHPLCKAINKKLAIIFNNPDINGAEKINYGNNIIFDEINEERGQGIVAKYNESNIYLGRKEFCLIGSGNIKNSDNNNISNYQEFITSRCFFKFNDIELLLLFNDSIKEDAHNAINNLKNIGEIIIMSGDNRIAVQNTANQLEIQQYYHDLTPIDKINILQQNIDKGRKILMIGDGINDAPALAMSLCSITFTDGADINKKTADIIIQGNKIMPIIDIIDNINFTLKIIKQNLAFSLFYNLIAIPFAITGLVTPLIAAIAMSSSSLIVLFNSLRITKFGND
jgi:Cu2+-exporting ATPase